MVLLTSDYNFYYNSGAITTERPASIEDGDFTKQSALVYFTCHTSPGENVKLYNALVSKLAGMCEERCNNYEKSKNK